MSAATAAKAGSQGFRVPPAGNRGLRADQWSAAFRQSGHGRRCGRAPAARSMRWRRQARWVTAPWCDPLNLRCRAPARAESLAYVLSAAPSAPCAMPSSTIAAVLDADDAVAGAHGGSRWAMMITVRPCTICAHVVLDDALALVVERAGRLVEDQDARVGGERAGDGDALALAAGEVGAALLDHRVVAVRQLGDELVGAGEPRHRDHLRARHGGIGERDVVVDRAVEQQVFLQHDADLAAQPAGIDLGDIDAVEQDLPLLGR